VPFTADEGVSREPASGAGLRDVGRSWAGHPCDPEERRSPIPALHPRPSSDMGSGLDVRRDYSRRWDPRFRVRRPRLGPARKPAFLRAHARVRVTLTAALRDHPSRVPPSVLLPTVDSLAFADFGLCAIASHAAFCSNRYEANARADHCQRHPRGGVAIGVHMAASLN
jgi:hypothetical protein